MKCQIYSVVIELVSRQHFLLFAYFVNNKCDISAQFACTLTYVACMKPCVRKILIHEALRVKKVLKDKIPQLQTICV